MNRLRRRTPKRDWLTLSASLISLAASTNDARRHVSDTETEVFTALNRIDGATSPILQTTMQLGQFSAAPIAAAVALIAKKPRLACGLAASGTGAWALARVVKHVARRGRPEAEVDEVEIRGRRWDGLGFPSGHTAVAAALTAVATPALPESARLIAWAAVAGVGLGRVHVGAHLPLDAVGGASLGIAIGTAVRAAVYE